MRAISDTLSFIENSLLQRIKLNLDLYHGKPAIRNKRYPVEMILDLPSAEMTHPEILDDYLALEEDDIRACLAYASRLISVKSIQRVLA